MALAYDNGYMTKVARFNERSQRARIDLWVKVKQRTTGRLNAKLVDISKTGFRIQYLGVLVQSEPLLLMIGGHAALKAKIVWSNAGGFGCQFAKPLSDKQLDEILGT